MKHLILNNEVHVQKVDKNINELRKNNELQVSCQSHCELFDNQMIVNEESKEVLSDHKKQMIKLHEENESIGSNQETQIEIILEIQCKLMENNLILEEILKTSISKPGAQQSTTVNFVYKIIKHGTNMNIS